MPACHPFDHKIAARNTVPLNCENAHHQAHIQAEKCSFWTVQKTCLRSNMFGVPARINISKSTFPSNMFLTRGSVSIVLQQQRQQPPVQQHDTADRYRYMTIRALLSANIKPRHLPPCGVAWRISATKHAFRYKIGALLPCCRHAKLFCLRRRRYNLLPFTLYFALRIFFTRILYTGLRFKP